MNLFLQGDSSIGKSFLLREILSDYTANLDGFTVQRLYQDRKVVGFRAIILDGRFEPIDEEYNPEKSGTFIFSNKRDLSVLENMIKQVEYNCKNNCRKIVLLDEIGGFEVVSETFQKSLYSILNSTKLCMGVLKSEDNLKRTLMKDSISNEYLACYKELIHKVTEKGQLYTMTQDNKNELRNILQQQLHSYMGETNDELDEFRKRL